MEWLLVIALILWMGWTAFTLSSLVAWAETISGNLAQIRKSLERSDVISEGVTEIARGLENASLNLGLIAQKLAVIIDEKDCEMYISAMMRDKGWTFEQSMSSWEDLRKQQAENELAEKYYSNLYAAAGMVIMSQEASISLLQRRLRIGYNQAAWIIEELETLGIIGPANSGQQRKILLTDREVEGCLQKLTLDEVSRSIAAFQARHG